MAYTEHEEFICPPDETKIWRYLDFPKFISMLSQSKLYFAKIKSILSADPLEGSPSRLFYELPFVRFEDLTDELKETLDIKDANRFYDFTSSLGIMNVGIERDKELTFVNCWHMNDGESAAMWRLYALEKQGLAVQSTIARLKQSFKGYKDHIFVGKVKYVDFETDFVPVRNALIPFLHKRKSFDHEKEVRAVIWSAPANEDVSNISGIEVPADIETLIEKVYVSPYAPAWHTLVVKNIVEKFSAVDVVYSKLNTPYM